MAELDGAGVPSMFTTDAELDPRAGLPASDDGLFYQSSHPFPIERREGIRIHDIGGAIKIDELRRIVAGEPERGLGQIVRAE